ncbi:hypothetical protein GCM10025734_80650 [Kitasatospora paranensis]|uniref:hypothetical protein n=1 Tax=Kitasatospora paranensis TaxID=258053 RepID=UPI0031E625C5
MLREHLDLAAHALRLRLRIGPTDRAGRVLAGAAPVVLGLLAGFCLWGLQSELPWVVRQIHGPHPVRRIGYVLYVAAGSVPWVLALAAAAVGRWWLTRALGLGGTVLGFGILLAFGPMTTMFLFGQPVFWTILGAVVLLAPPTLLDRSARAGREATAVAVTFAAVMIASQSSGLWVYFTGSTILHMYVSWPLFAAAAVLLGHLAGEHRDRHRAVGAGLAGALWLTPGLLDEHITRHTLTTWVAGYVLLVALTVALAMGIRMIRRARPGESADPA